MRQITCIWYKWEEIFPLPLKQEGIVNGGCPCCIWCIRGHSSAGSYCQCQPYSCLLQSIQVQWVLRVCWHVAIIVAITVIVIVEWHWRLDVFNGITTLIVALDVTLGFARVWQGQLKSTVAQGLCQRSSACSDISCAWNVTSLLLFFPTKANLWYRGWSLWWLCWSQLWLSYCGALGIQRWWQSMSIRFVT